MIFFPNGFTSDSYLCGEKPLHTIHLAEVHGWWQDVDAARVVRGHGELRTISFHVCEFVPFSILHAFSAACIA